MRRGIHHTTALKTPLQFSSILSEGARMSRKSLRLRNWLQSFGNFIIEFIRNHGTDNHRYLLLSRIHRAVSRTATDHSKTWQLSRNDLWNALTTKIRRIMRQQGFTRSYRELIESIINSPFTPRKRQRSPDPCITTDI